MFYCLVGSKLNFRLFIAFKVFGIDSYSRLEHLAMGCNWKMTANKLYLSIA
jgi:hypothetical protein